MARNMGHENALYLLGIQSSLSTEVEGQYSFRLELGGDGESDCLSVYHPHHTASFTVLHMGADVRCVRALRTWKTASTAKTT